MFRVVTDMTPHGSCRSLDRGPWHTSREVAESWASLLTSLGYKVTIESQFGPVADNKNKMLFI